MGYPTGTWESLRSPYIPLPDTVDALFAGDTRTIGLRMEAGAEPKVSIVSGLSIVTVGTLSDLPKLMRKLS